MERTGIEKRKKGKIDKGHITTTNSYASNNIGQGIIKQNALVIVRKAWLKKKQPCREVYKYFFQSLSHRQKLRED